MLRGYNHSCSCASTRQSVWQFLIWWRVDVEVAQGYTTSKATPRQRLHHVKGYTMSKATPRQRLHHVKGYTTSKATPRQRLHHVKGYTTSIALLCRCKVLLFPGQCLWQTVYKVWQWGWRNQNWRGVQGSRWHWEAASACSRSVHKEGWWHMALYYHEDSSSHVQGRQWERDRWLLPKSKAEQACQGMWECGPGKETE